MTRRLRALLVLLGLVWPSLALGATLTIMPTSFQTVVDGNGHPINGAKVCTYVAGTTTAIATYTDVNGGTQNLNPIRADSAGRFTAWLIPGTSYKFVYQDASGTSNTCDGVTYYTVDNINAIPGSSAGVDISPAFAGETLTAGQAVYLSDGSGGKIAGQWYKADSANTYSSSAAVVVGITPSTIISGSSGAIRLVGQVSGLSSLTVGLTYYVGTAGALTTTAPSNVRALGMADTTSTLVLQANPSVPNADNGIEDFRLTLTTATPYTSADVSGASAVTLYATPAGKGNRITLFNTSGAPTVYTSVEFSIAVPATTSQMYDVFGFVSGSTPTLELLAWTNDTTRATAIVLTTTGIYTKSGDLTRRYLGSFRTTTVSGQTEDSLTKRFVYNYYNRANRALKSPIETTDSWDYSTATWRQARATATNQVEFVIGAVEESADFTLMAEGSHNVASDFIFVAIGLDSTTTPAVTCFPGAASAALGGARFPLISRMQAVPAIGYHKAVWLEAGDGNITGTFYGDNGNPTFMQTGLMGTVRQ